MLSPLGGAPYLAWRLDVYRKQGLSEVEVKHKAMADFTAKANEAQQSTKQSQLGKAQTTQFGKYVLAFQNATIQFNRKMSKSLRDMQAGKNVGVNALNIGYLTTFQYALFSFFQKAMLNAFIDDDDDEEKDEKKIEGWLLGLGSSVLGARGIAGQFQGALLDLFAKRSKIFKEGSLETKYGAYETILSETANTFPAVSAKARLVKKTLNKPYKESDGYVEIPEWVSRSSAAVELTGIPTARLLKLFEGFNDMGASDLDLLQKTSRVGGWSRYDLQKELGKIKDTKNSPNIDIDLSDFDDLDIDFQ